jgi:ribosome biogenesis GTPase A
MPPKSKKGEPEKKVLLGRPGNNLKTGIVGVPNVGKSSFFNLLSKVCFTRDQLDLAGS